MSRHQHIHLTAIAKICLMRINMPSRNCWNCTVAQIPKCTRPISHNAPFCNRNVHMCTFLLQNGALGDICLMCCGICEMGLSCASSYLSNWYCLIIWPSPKVPLDVGWDFFQLIHMYIYIYVTSHSFSLTFQAWWHGQEYPQILQPVWVSGVLYIYIYIFSITCILNSSITFNKTICNCIWLGYTCTRMHIHNLGK